MTQDVAPLGRDASCGIGQEVERHARRSLGLTRGANELQHFAPVRVAKRPRIHAQKNGCEAFHERPHDSTFFARAVASNPAMRALSACSTRVPSRVMR